jgi:internalin A
MIDIKKSLLIALMLYTGLFSIAWAEITEQGQKEKQPSTWELIRKSQMKKAESAEPVIAERVLHFPKERSLGELMIEQEDQEDSLKSFGGYPFEEIRWERYGQAQGDVKIPLDKKVRLILNSWTWQNPNNLSVLKQLKPDDIYSLTLSPAWSPGGIGPNDKCMPYVAHLAGLNTLNLDGANITTKGLKYLQELKSLKRLKPPGSLDDAGMILIGKIRTLNVLYIGEDNLITNASLKQLSNLEFLEILVLNSVHMTDEGLAALCDIPLLRHLIIQGNFANDAPLYLKGALSLRTLKTDSPRFNDIGMRNVSSLTQLENFDAHWIENITDSGAANLKNMPNLKKLDVGHAKLTDKAMLDLNKITNLEYLFLPYSGLTDEGLKHISQLHNLKYLWSNSSSGSPLTDQSLYSICTLTNLEELHIGGKGFSDEGMKHIAKLTKLKRLSIFRASQLTDKGMTELASLESLTDLNLGCRVSISGLKSLNKLKKLKRLHLRDVHQDNSILDISGLTKLERLRLSLSYERKGKSVIYESFQDEDLTCLSKLTRLETLTLAGAGINNEGIRNISGLTNLIHLNIICPGETQINDDSLKHLTNMQRLYELNIRDGHFTDGALDYLDGLPSLSRLELTSDYAFSNQAIRDFQKKYPNITRLQLIP